MAEPFLGTQRTSRYQTILTGLFHILLLALVTHCSKQNGGAIVRSGSGNNPGQQGNTPPPGTSSSLVTGDPRDVWIDAAKAPAAGMRMLSVFEMTQTLTSTLGVTPDFSRVEIESTAHSLQPLFSTNSVRDSNTLRELLRSLTDVSARAPVLTIFACESGAACVTNGIAKVGQSLWRRPLTAAEKTAFKTHYDAWALNQTHEFSLRMILQDMIFSPYFLYLNNMPKVGVTNQQLDSWQVAEKLSYFIAGTAPDATLQAKAQSQEILQENARRDEVKRLLATAQGAKRLGYIVQNWLGAERPALEKKDLTDLNAATLEADMRTEVNMLVADIWLNKRLPFSNIFKANQTFMNDQIAKVYGAPGVSGSDFRAVSLTALPRSGILTTPLVMATNAKEKGRSSMQRGTLLMSRLLCQGFPDHAGNIVAVLPADSAKLSSRRQQFQMLENSMPCANCHRIINAGFAFDRFDPIGRAFAVQEVPDSELKSSYFMGAGKQIDFSGPQDLSARVADLDLTKKCFVNNIFRFAEGRTPGTQDTQTMTDLMNQFEEDRYVIPDFLESVVASEQFIKSSSL